MISREDAMMLGQFTINGEPHQFAIQEFGHTIGVPPTGFNQYVKCQWLESCNKEEVMHQVLGQVPEAGSSTTSHEKMSIVSKIMFMYVICNVCPKLEGIEKITIEYYLLVDELLKQQPVSLPQIVMKHLEHARSILKHGIPFGALIKCLLTSLGIYKDGDNPLFLGKPLDMKCLGQASFKFDKKEGVWLRV